MGAFKYKIPLDVVNQFLTISSLDIKNYKDENGYTIYTTGDFKVYKDAAELIEKLKMKNFSDAFVVAYRNGKKVPIEGLSD